MSTVEEKEDEEILINRVWFNLFRVYRHLSPKIEKRLKAAGVGHPIWYELLIQVERAGDRGINLVTLQHQLFLPQYALSRHVARVEKAGYIRREVDREDARSQRVFITEQGRNLHEQIWPHYFQAIQDELAHRLTRQEAETLFRLLIKLYP